MNRIKFFRTKYGLTVKELSVKSDIAIGYLSDLENGNAKNPSLRTMRKIAAALGQTVPDVFFPKEKKEVR